MGNLRNKVQLIGNVGNDPEMTVLESGKKVIRFSLATNEYYKNAKGGKVQSTDWHNMVAWRNVILFRLESGCKYNRFFNYPKLKKTILP